MLERLYLDALRMHRMGSEGASWRLGGPNRSLVSELSMNDEPHRPPCTRHGCCGAAKPTRGGSNVLKAFRKD